MASSLGRMRGNLHQTFSKVTSTCAERYQSRVQTCPNAAVPTAALDDGRLPSVLRDQTPGQWRRSTRCVSNNHCVEVADLAAGIGIRNSQREMSLIFDTTAWANFVEALKGGDFDPPR